MTSLLRYISTSLSSPVLGAPNALAFSSPSATQLAPVQHSSSNLKTQLPSPTSLMGFDGTPKSNKKRRFRGWVCEDEISEGETALLEKLEAQGQEFSTEPLISKTKGDITHNTSSAMFQPPSDAVSSRNTRRRHNSTGFDLNKDVPPLRRSLPAGSIKGPDKSRYHRKRQKIGSTQRREGPEISRSASSRGPTTTYKVTANMPHALNIDDRQQPRKKPRFRGYICEDEVEEEDPALADAIRRKGTIFQVKEAAPSRSPSTGTLEDREKDSRTDFTLPEVCRVPNVSFASRKYDLLIFIGLSQSSRLPSGHSFQEQLRSAEDVEHAKFKELTPRHRTVRSGLGELKSKRRKVRASHLRTPTSKLVPLFPNLSSTSQIALSTTTSPAPSAPSSDSMKLPALARAQKLVTSSTSDFKTLTAIADQAAKAAAIAKRKAGDAANKLEEAKRLLRVENEKEKCRKDGKRFKSGWVYVESEGDEQDGDDAESGKPRAKYRTKTWKDRRKMVEGAHLENQALQIDQLAQFEESQEEDEDDEADKEEAEGDGEDSDDDDDDEEDMDEDEDDDDDDDDEVGFSLGRTADLLG